MNTNNDQVVKFKAQFQQRLDLANEAAVASLIYALVYVHQDATRTDPPFILNLIYHPTWGEYVYANPILLQEVVERVSKRRLVNPDALVVWRGIADLCKAMHDKEQKKEHDKEHDKKNEEDDLNCLKVALNAYIDALKKPKIPQTGEEQKTMDAVVEFHEFLDELLKNADLDVVPKHGAMQSYKDAALKLPGFAIALNWIAGVLGEKMEGAVVLLQQLLDGKSDSDPTNSKDGLTSNPTGSKCEPCRLERTLLKTIVVDVWAQEG